MPDYSKGKIYCIRSYQTDTIYIGSTTQALSRRMTEHRCKSNRSNRLTSNAITQYDDAYIELIEEYPCNNIDQLKAREQYHIRGSDNCINKNIPGRSRKEYYDENIEKIRSYYHRDIERNRQKHRDYYAANKERINASRQMKRAKNKLSSDSIENNGASPE